MERRDSIQGNILMASLASVFDSLMQSFLVEEREFDSPLVADTMQMVDSSELPSLEASFKDFIRLLCQERYRSFYERIKSFCVDNWISVYNREANKNGKSFCELLHDLITAMENELKRVFEQDKSDVELSSIRESLEQMLMNMVRCDAWFPSSSEARFCCRT